MIEVNRRIDALHEQNPMLGHRGCRLGVTFPEIYMMQVEAIANAAVNCAKRGIKVLPEIMVPLVAIEAELASLKNQIQKRIEEVIDSSGEKIEYKIGTMIELPRAAILAGVLAEHAEFFSFGTNDLTQTTYGLSRDDAGKFLPDYISKGFLENDPFVVLDQSGVGRLVKYASDQARVARPGVHLGICGEHGGEPRSIEFCHKIGLDYVSCSPYRVPIARLAAAQANVREF